MRIKTFILLFVLIFFNANSNAQQKNYVIHTVAFYNFENLFDTINDPVTNDEEWTPTGMQRWTSTKYRHKLQNLA
ncbi:MAG: endonuclease/exonuclease/phosphatase family protein, partial [bacterium]|nr:endonuclease/exonuclease/phosphatase family protein [bacterium]